jgi:hypothetical protein
VGGKEEGAGLAPLGCVHTAAAGNGGCGKAALAIRESPRHSTARGTLSHDAAGTPSQAAAAPGAPNADEASRRAHLPAGISQRDLDLVNLITLVNLPAYLRNLVNLRNLDPLLLLPFLLF